MPLSVTGRCSKGAVWLPKQGVARWQTLSGSPCQQFSSRICRQGLHVSLALRCESTASLSIEGVPLRGIADPFMVAGVRGWSAPNSGNARSRESASKPGPPNPKTVSGTVAVQHSLSLFRTQAAFRQVVEGKRRRCCKMLYSKRPTQRIEAKADGL